MFTDIHLLNVPELDAQYNHTFTFGTFNQQIQFFLSRTEFTIENVNYHRKNNNLKVNYHIDDLGLVNYVMVNNEQPKNKWYFYFVIDKVYINERCTELILSIDVMQTYMFDYTFRECLIERMHYNRWKSDGSVNRKYHYLGDNIVNPASMVKSSEWVYSYENGTHNDPKGVFVIASSTMLGKDNTSSSSGGGSSNNTEIATDLKITEDFFVTIKSYEGFSSLPYNIGDGTNTIGYGVTEVYRPTEYNQLAPSCTETQASKILLTILVNDYYAPIYNDIISKRTNPRRNEIDAFVDLAYNCGVGGCQASPMYKAYVNNKPLSECTNGWYDYRINAGTSNERGLRNRRNNEVNMFLYGKYEKRNILVLQGGYVTDNNGKGFIPEDVITSNKTSSVVIQSAEKLINWKVPYDLGNIYTPLERYCTRDCRLDYGTGVDCTSMCMWAYHDAGLLDRTPLPATRWNTWNIEDQFKLISDVSYAKAGDILLMYPNNTGYSHGALIEEIVGTTVKCIEAQDYGTTVCRTSHVFNSSTMEIRRPINS